MGAGRGHHSEALIWAPGRSESGLQPAKARTPVALVSHLFHRQPAVWSWMWRCRRGTRRRLRLPSRSCGHLLDGLPKSSQPQFVRGDCNWGTDRAMEGCEQRQQPYLFKLKQSLNVKKLINRLFGHDQWVDAGQKWQGTGHETEAGRLEKRSGG